MIPKVVHYCWLSNDPYPENIAACIESWKKYLPDYEFVKWDFNRINKNDYKWVSQAFDCKKYAFAADYIRAYAIYNYGGIYLDSDVEVIKSFDDLLVHPYFMGCEFNKKSPEAAVIGAEKGHPFFKKLLQYYEGREFVKKDGTLDRRTLPSIFREIIDTDFCECQINNPGDIDDADTSKYASCLTTFCHQSPQLMVKFIKQGKHTQSITLQIHGFLNIM